MFQHTSVTQTVPPTVSPVTVLEAKVQLHLETTEDDHMIQHYIDVATAYCEHYTQRALLTQQYTAYYSTVPHCIVLPFPPALPEPAPIVEYKNDLGEWEEVDPSDYVYNWTSQPATICRNNCGPILPGSDGNVWCLPLWGRPGCDNGAPVFRVTWWAGYGEGGSSVPLLVKQAILLLTAHYYERRLASDNFSETEIPFGVTVLLDSIRWRFYA